MSLVVAVATIAAALPALILSAAPVGAAACPAVHLVYARGSAAVLNDDEYRDTVAALTRSLGGVRPAVTELGDQDANRRVDPGGYPAVPVEQGLGWDFSSDFSAGDLVVMARYNESRRIGSEEFVRVVNRIATNCPTTRLVAVGYSQGAQAIGVGLRSLRPEVLDRIVSVVFYGDPTIAVGYRGARAPWLRAPGYHWTTPGGLLGARDPYVPDSIVARTRSYCGLADPVCTGNPFLALWKLMPCDKWWWSVECRSTHDDYARWAIGPAMAEAARATTARA